MAYYHRQTGVRVWQSFGAIWLAATTKRNKSKEAPKDSNPPETNPKPPATAPVKPKQGPQPSSKKKSKYLILSLCLITVCLGAAWLLSQYSLLKIDVAGVPMSNQLGSQASREKLEQAIKNYNILLTYPDGISKDFAPAEMGIGFDINETVAKVVEAQGGDNVLRRLMFWRKTSLPFSLQFNELKLHDFLRKSATRVTTKYNNASISINEGKVTVKPEKAGSGYTIPGLEDGLLAAVSSLQSSPLKLEPSTLEPKITTANIQATAEQVEDILSHSVSFKISDQTIEASATNIAGWLEFTPVETDHSIDITVNGGKVVEYIDSISGFFIQPIKSQVVLDQPDGGLRVLVAGQNGTDVHNKKKVAATLAEQLLADENLHFDLPVSFKAFNTINAKAYDKWLLVDLTSKRMYAYQKAKLVKTFLISAGAPETPTVLGEFRIYHKLASQDMQGPNTDGSRYFAPDVPWVNYFHESYAIHGNYWRPASWFGNINSSHGCVGILPDDGKWVFDWAPQGTPVITYQ